MIHKLLAVILAAGAFLALTEGQKAHDQLTELEKKGVDLALQNLNSHPSTEHHILFSKTLDKFSSEAHFDDRFVYHNFYAKATTCTKQTEDPDPKQCPFRGDRPLIDCVICYKGHLENIVSEPKPYVSCVRRPALTEEIKNKRNEQCKTIQHSIGTITLLGTKGT
uniref:Retinoic acid receptor responder protein 2 n=1 Tax=Scleropages formosus TaxID=113540 RepID=A0A8C9SEX9_SCLFO